MTVSVSQSVKVKFDINCNSNFSKFQEIKCDKYLNTYEINVLNDNLFLTRFIKFIFQMSNGEYRHVWRIVVRNFINSFRPRQISGNNMGKGLKLA